ncbi:unnamed protein product [Strongylus vulgaris]|uniref:Uncharacterized protein n=1 Tax=Strongylus vulgaris TaxID=40348 RepID=A0A3P7JVM5_STRVU|nr:unnamed protein product [Strongylus vulgaris]
MYRPFPNIMHDRRKLQKSIKAIHIGFAVQGLHIARVVAAVDACGFAYVNLLLFPGSMHGTVIYTCSQIKNVLKQRRTLSGYCFLEGSGFANGNDIIITARKSSD